MPVWANEGLAEVYATFQQNAGGKTVTLGMPNAQHLELLRNATMIPLTELLAVDHTSRLYNEDNRRGLFYAESWALVHYLTYGNPARRQQLGVYLAKLALGTSPDLAFRDAFQIEVPALEQELQSYVRKFAFPTVRVDMGERASPARGKPAQAIAEYDAAAYLSDLIARVGRDDEEARTRLRGILDAHGDSWRAALVLGRLELRAGHLNDALPLLERAVKLAPDDASVQAAWGKANFAQYHDGLGNDLPATLSTARAALNKAIALAPNEAATIALLGDLSSWPAPTSRLPPRCSNVRSLSHPPVNGIASTLRRHTRCSRIARAPSRLWDSSSRVARRPNPGGGAHVPCPRGVAARSLAAASQPSQRRRARHRHHRHRAVHFRAEG